MITIAAALALLAGCGEPDVPVHQRILGADPEAGRRAIVAYGCGACHSVPGIRSAIGTVGPHLTGFGRRTYIAGLLPNRPASLVRWIRDPPAVAPETPMPNLRVTEEDARNIAAYLYSLR